MGVKPTTATPDMGTREGGSGREQRPAASWDTCLGTETMVTMAAGRTLPTQARHSGASLAHITPPHSPPPHSPHSEEEEGEGAREPEQHQALEEQRDGSFVKCSNFETGLFGNQGRKTISELHQPRPKIY